MSISLIPPKGTSDRFPQEYKLRSAIFSVWRKVCQSFGYEEYLWPIVEYADVYRAKSGEDVWWSELTIIVDRAGRELALRPEMTPTVTRMVASRYAQLPKPVRYFSIANFFRNERPQRWRNREFRQLNFDCFGSQSLFADSEVIQMGIEIMLGYGAPKNSFVVYLNDRRVIDVFLHETVWLDANHKKEAVRVMDKWEKLMREDFQKTLLEKWLTGEQIKLIVEFLENDSLENLWEIWADLKKVYDHLCDLWYKDYIQFKWSLMRWFDYYDWIVFEFFDTHPDNRRAMFGGGRYNGLATIFGVDAFPAVGAAPWDEPARLFIESWGLSDSLINRFTQKSTYYVPLLVDEAQITLHHIAQELREKNNTVVITSLEMKKLSKAIEFADKQWYDYIVILWWNELEQGIYQIKDLKSGEVESVKLKV